jgi:hypothetical protein
MFNEPALRKLLATLGVKSAGEVTIGQLAPTSAGAPSVPQSEKGGVQPGTTRPGAGAQYFAAMGDRATMITVAEYALLKAWGAAVDETPR